MTSKVIKAEDAAANLSAVIKDVAVGNPVSIVTHDGVEVVIVSKSYFDKAEHLIKSPLLSSGFASPGESDLDRALKDVRVSSNSKGRGSDAEDP